jgi:hypothetical protein
MHPTGQGRRRHRHQIGEPGESVDEVNVALEPPVEAYPRLGRHEVVVDLVDNRPPAQHRPVPFDLVQQGANDPVTVDGRVAGLLAMTLEAGRVRSHVVAVLAADDGPVPAPEDQHVRPFDRRQVDGGYAVSDGIIEAVDVVGGDLDSIVVEFAPRPELHVVPAQQVAVHAQAHGVADAGVDRAVDEHTQGLSHYQGIICAARVPDNGASVAPKRGGCEVLTHSGTDVSG